VNGLLLGLVGLAIGALAGFGFGRRRATVAEPARPTEAARPAEPAPSVQIAPAAPPEPVAAAPATAREDGGPAGDRASDRAGGDIGGLLRDALQHLDIGVVVCAPTGKIVYRNDSATKLQGTHIGVLVEEHIESNLAAARRGERTTRSVELHGPPRTWLAIQAEPLPAGGAVVTTQDVSERMRTDAMRTDFVTNISHELKTPVGALAVLADAIDGETDPEVVHRVLQRIVAEAHRAVNTIDDLLRLSQIESARTDDEVIELAAVVQTAIGRGRHADGGRGVRVMAIDPSEPIRVLADGRQLTSAIGNLVENAVKYSKDGGIVQVRSRLAGRWVEIMVADQGIGIPERDLDRIFERFYRVDKARSRDTGGTGLGLAIVQHVASNHGGDVQVSSEEGEGSTFVFRLPASLVVEDDDATETPESEGNDAKTEMSE
jgi:two-component system, OmpR family, sensor histidine kinase SenX3